MKFKIGDKLRAISSGTEVTVNSTFSQDRVGRYLIDYGSEFPKNWLPVNYVEREYEKITESDSLSIKFDRPIRVEVLSSREIRIHLT